MSEPSPVDSPPGEEAPASPPAQPSRGRAASFVVIFLVTTFGLLTVFQFMSDSMAMQRYLFTVASHTALVLNLVGDSSYLEFENPEDLPMDQQGQYRAEIAAWERGETPPNLPKEERAVGPPLTRWEWFRHRTLREQHDIRVEVAIIEALTNAPRPAAFDNPQQHIDFLVERATLIERSIYRPLPGGGTRDRTERDTLRKLQEAQRNLQTLTAQPFELNEDSFRALLAIDELLEEARVAQLAYAERRLGHLREFVANAGPLVQVIWRGGLRGDVHDARLALTRIHADPKLTEAERVAAASAKRHELSQLEASLREQSQQGAPTEVIEGKRFRFTIIPECGAIETMAIFVAAVLGFPTTVLKRLAGVLLGIPILYAVNVFRLACLGFIGAWTQDISIFEFAHHYVWQAVYLVFVVVIWLAWMEVFVRRGEKSSPADA